jgi:hypothetical protein
VTYKLNTHMISAAALALTVLATALSDTFTVSVAPTGQAPLPRELAMSYPAALMVGVRG